MTQPSTPSEDHGPVLAATPARQGRYGKHVFWVLVVSTVLAAAGLFAAWGWKAPDLAKPGSHQSVTAGSTVDAQANANAFHRDAPAPIVAPPGTDHTAPGPQVTPQSR